MNQNYPYCAEKISRKITRIRDHDVFLYLVEGDKTAALLDTGHGIGGNIKAFVETLTTLPIVVILTHSHEDHVGGAGWFKTVYLHLDDLADYKALSSVEERFKKHQKKEFKSYSLDDYAPEFPDPLPLYDGQEFDLGALTLRVIECCGHTQGSVVVLIKEERAILFGDAIGRRVCLFHGVTVQEYLQSLKRVSCYAEAYDLCLRCHNEGVISKEVLSELIECCERILEERDDAQPIVFQHADGRSTACFAAKAVNETTQRRIDGKSGNIFYLKQRIR